MIKLKLEVFVILQILIISGLTFYCENSEINITQRNGVGFSVNHSLPICCGEFDPLKSGSIRLTADLPTTKISSEITFGICSP